MTDFLFKKKVYLIYLFSKTSKSDLFLRSWGWQVFMPLIYGGQNKQQCAKKGSKSKAYVLFKTLWGQGKTWRRIYKDLGKRHPRYSESPSALTRGCVIRQWQMLLTWSVVKEVCKYILNASPCAFVLRHVWLSLRKKGNTWVGSERYVPCVPLRNIKRIPHFRF